MPRSSRSTRCLSVLLAASVLIGVAVPSALGQAGAASPELNSMWSRLNQIYVQSNMLNTDDASEVEIMLKAAIEKSGVLYGADSEEVLQATLELARLYRMQSRYGELKLLLPRAVAIYEKLPQAARRPFSGSMLEAACDLVNRSKVKEANLLLAPVLENLKTDRAQLDDQAFLSRLTSLAQSLKSRREFAACEPIYRAILFAIENKQPVNQVTLADARTQLAEVLKETGNTSTAMELATLALAEQEKAGTAGLSSMVPTLSLLTYLELASGKTESAARSAVKLDSALAKAVVCDRGGVFRSLLELCKQFAQVNDSQSVALLFGRSLAFADQYSYSYYDNSLREISRYLIASGNSSRAEALYGQLLQWVERPGVNVDAGYLPNVISMQARFFIQSGQFDKLDKVMTRLAAFDSEHQTRNLRNLQSEVEQSGSLSAREKLYSLLIAGEASSARDRLQLVNYRNKLAQMYVQSGRTGEAKSQWFEITTVLEKNVPEDCRDIGAEVRTVLDAYITEKRYQDAQQLVNNMVTYGFNRDIQVSVANGFTALATHHEQLGNLDKALSLVQRSLLVAQKYGGKDTYNFADALGQYAGLLRKSGQTAAADDADKQSKQLLEDLQKRGVRRYG